MRITRRQGLLAAAASAIGWSAAGEAFAQQQRRRRTATPTRKSVQSLSADELTIYHDAVRAMRQNEDYGDPRSWMYWAWMHDYDAADVKAAVAGAKLSKADALALTGFSEVEFDEADVWMLNQARRADPARAWAICPHHDMAKLFLPWHRAYLLFFEETLRSYIADRRQAQAFRMPYFDPFATRGQIPDVYAQPTRNGEQNWLYHERNQKIATSALNYAYDQGLAKGVENAASTSAAIAVFQNYLESAHDTVHSQVGKDMGSTGTAARDPLFWAHHANVDRQWTVLDRTGAHSVASGWPGEMPFRVSRTETRRIAPSAMCSITTLPAAQRYAYEDERNIVSGGAWERRATPLPQPPRRALTAPGNTQALHSGALSLSRRRGVSVESGELLALRLGVPAVAQADMRAVIEGGRSLQREATLVLENVRVRGDGDPGQFLVAVGVRDNSSDDLTPLVVGSLSRWIVETAMHEPGHEAQHANDDGVTLRFSLNDRPAINAEDQSALEVWFVPTSEVQSADAFDIGEARLEFAVTR